MLTLVGLAATAFITLAIVVLATRSRFVIGLMTVAVVALSVSTAVDSQDAVARGTLTSLDVILSQVYSIVIAAGAVLVVAWPVQALRNRSEQWPLLGLVTVLSTVLFGGFLYMSLFLDLAIWRSVGLCLFPGDPVSGPPATCDFDKRHKALIPAALLLLITYGLALSRPWRGGPRRLADRSR